MTCGAAQNVHFKEFNMKGDFLKDEENGIKYFIC